MVLVPQRNIFRESHPPRGRAARRFSEAVDQRTADLFLAPGSQRPGKNCGCGMRQVASMEDPIAMDPAICNGRPALKGARITVQTVMEFLAAGNSVDDILEVYPSLTLKV